MIKFAPFRACAENCLMSPRGYIQGPYRGASQGRSKGVVIEVIWALGAVGTVLWLVHLLHG